MGMLNFVEGILEAIEDCMELGNRMDLYIESDNFCARHSIPAENIVFGKGYLEVDFGSHYIQVKLNTNHIYNKEDTGDYLEYRELTVDDGNIKYIFGYYLND